MRTHEINRTNNKVVRLFLISLLLLFPGCSLISNSHIGINSSPATHSTDKGDIVLSKNKSTKQFDDLRYFVEKETGGGFSADNPAMEYWIKFDPNKVQLSSYNSQNSSRDLNMRLLAYGYSGNLHKVKKGKIQAVNNRLTYIRGNLEEWYINTSTGVEQGFTLQKPPGNQGSRELIFLVSINGDLKLHMDPFSKKIELYDSKYRKKLTYHKLKVVDSNGKVLDSRMEPWSDDNTERKGILIAVDDTLAHYPLIVDPEISTPKLLASDGSVSDEFGYSVSISGNTVVVGAENDDDNGSDSGSAYIFRRNQGGTDHWGQVTKLTAPDGAAEDYFGIAVTIAGDTVIVGAYGDDDNGSFSGSAYIFEKDRGGTDNWGQVAKLTAYDATIGDAFGYGVSISEDTAVVGAYGDDDNGSFSGSAYIFERDQGGTDNWGQVAKLTASDGASNDSFGHSVSISEDTVVVGGHQYHNNGAGAAYIYERDQGGTDNWGQVAKLNSVDGVDDDRFAISVYISGDTVVVGADGDDDHGSFSGSAYIYERNEGGINNWGGVAKLTAPDGDVNDYFGSHKSVSISGDTVVIAADSDDDKGIDSGSAYIYERNHGGVNNWGQIAKFTAADGITADTFGFSVSIAGDTVVFGSRWDDENGSESGSAYILDGIPTLSTNTVLFTAVGIAANIGSKETSTNSNTSSK